MSIVQIISLTGTQLEKRGDLYVGLCPLHHDKDTPSLTIYPRTDSWCCFGGCKPKKGRYNGGDSVEFIAQYYHWSYLDAKVWVERQLGTLPKLPEIKSPPKIKPVVDQAILYWHSLLDVAGKRSYFHSRLFTDETINRELWGWDGENFIIPVWEGEPGQSQIVGVRRRSSKEGPKYTGIKGINTPTVWGRWYCRGQREIFAFAGEFDAALANQDGYPAFSMVNGMSAFKAFPDEWPELWFPEAKRLTVVFDKKEEPIAGQLAHSWNKVKGTMSAKVFHWPPHVNAKDYNDYRKLNTKPPF